MRPLPPVSLGIKNVKFKFVRMETRAVNIIPEKINKGNSKSTSEVEEDIKV